MSNKKVPVEIRFIGKMEVQLDQWDAISSELDQYLIGNLWHAISEGLHKALSYELKQ